MNIRSIVGSSDVRSPLPCLSRLLESVGQLQDSQVVLMPADDVQMQLWNHVTDGAEVDLRVAQVFFEHFGNGGAAGLQTHQ